MHRVTLIPGDGIGPEVVACARQVIAATGVAIAWDVVELRAGAPLDEALDSIRRNRVGLKGPLTTPAGVASPNVGLRRALDLYAQVRLCRRPGVSGVDVAVIRETTEDLYAGIEFAAGEAGELLRRFDVDPAAAVALKPVSAAASRRVAAFAFEWARRRGRNRVTVVHKAAVMPQTDGLFVAAARDVAAGYPDIELDELAVDAAAAKVVSRPEAFDVLLTLNLYGDILADLAAALAGGIGVAPGANFGDEAAVFEPTHGSAPRHAGANRVNPIAAILSGALLLRHLGEDEAASRVEGAVDRVVAAGRSVTYDLGGDASTTALADAVRRELA